MAQLALVFYSVTYLPFPSNETFPGAAFNWYGAASGGSNRYGFFKEVGSACRATFVMSDEEGHAWEDTLDHGITNEASLRYQGAMFIYPEWGEALSSQWAATMFGRHPTAYQVDVYFESMDVPTMEEFRAGKRPEWKQTVHDVFLRRDMLEKRLLQNATSQE
jgi:hypothetical protein